MYVDFTNTPYLESSKVLAHAKRLNWRTEVLIARNRKFFEGKRVLDLASHDGRFSYSALQGGASYVKGVEGRQEAVDEAFSNMEKMQIDKSKYDFEQGDLTAFLRTVEPGEFDVILCFGVFSHLVSQFEVLAEVKRIQPSLFILDTWVAREPMFKNFRNKMVNYIVNRSIDSVQLNNRQTGKWNIFNHLRKIVKQPSGSIVLLYEDPNAPGATIDKSGLMAWATNDALRMMFSHFDFNATEVDWHQQGLEDWRQLTDYKNAKRVSWLLQPSNTK